MEIYKEVVIPERTERVIVNTVCDICGKDIEGSLGNYEVDDVIIRHKTGDNWPEGSDIDTFEPDICPKCFKEKIVPFLESIGVKIEYKNEWNM